MIASEFQKRHDFDSEELAVLKAHYPSISFTDIPEAWIYILDQMLERISGKVRKVYQLCGYLIVEASLSDDEMNIVERFERKLYEADIDLHDTALN
jgi:hypothetical protein